jgi:hypothetical protein
MDWVKQVGIPFQELTDKLLADGVNQFANAFAKLLKATDRSGKAYDHDPTDFLRVKLARELYKGRPHSRAQSLGR